MNGRVKSSKHKEMDALHKKSIRNHSYFLQPGLAGCFYCLKIFDVSAVQAWVDKGETALWNSERGKSPFETVRGN